MDKLLKLYTYVDGGINDTPFPNTENQIEIGAFRYDAKRMGGAPTITASVNYPSCLDDEWTDGVYAEFNGEKFYLKQIPTSSYNNTSAMYKHDIELVSERIALDNVYFFDVVTGDIVEDDKPVSNSTKVVFFGDVSDFANRLKASLTYSALDYDVVVDEGVASEEKLMSFEDQFFSNVLQEIYNTYEVPYYFEGKTIHIGYSKPTEELPSFAYGVDEALLSITKNNANYKIVNRATGSGSSENIPFYYPNNSPKGDIEATPNREGLDVVVFDNQLFSNSVELEESIRYESAPNIQISRVESPIGGVITSGYMFSRFHETYLGFSDEYKMYVSTDKEAKISLYVKPVGGFLKYQGDNPEAGDDASQVREMLLFINGEQLEKNQVDEEGREWFSITVPQGTTTINIYVSYKFTNVSPQDSLFGQTGLEFGLESNYVSSWYKGGKVVDPTKLGIRIESEPQDGDTVTQTLLRYINPSSVLLPPKYRNTDGKERFYNATNDTYEGVTFNNPFVVGRPKEHIIKVEDIKPSIEGMVVNGVRVDMFEDFAYDIDDNDETYEDEEGNVFYKHPYFFAKLKPLGFNLFDHAIEQQPMTISFTSGACGACNFEIAVDEESQKNTVQVDENGNLVYDENGRVLCGAEGSGQGEVQPQPEQQDTTSHSVWIALQKEDSTYGIFMPKAPINGVGGHRPSTGDTFVILGINFPYEYIENAEKRLEAEIIKYLKDNNDEKFTFSIGFSRIYFAENEEILNSLNENSKIQITYDNKTYELYVSSFSYTMSEGDALPEIRVELDETLKTSQNALQNAISEVKSTLGNAINQVSQSVSQERRSYVSKRTDDTAMGVVDFSKGIKFGEGGKVEVLDNNSAKLTIEYLEVTKKATFTSLEIQEKTHVGGQILVTPASMNCGEVEELDDVYRCYFQTKGEGGEEIFNQFAVGDQAICQTFNAWGSKYYWRLITAIGEDYIDLSKDDCDEGSGIPEAGDKIIQMGNRIDANRQNAIVIAAYGDNSPYIVQYKGISNYDLPQAEDDERITTLLSPTKNILTGQVRMTAGSSGLELFDEWAAKQQLIDSKASGEDFGAFQKAVTDTLGEFQDQIDGAIETWFYDPVPTLENAPAVDWTTDDDKNNHLGDLYYSGEGKAYRFQYEEGKGYYWNLIADEDITEALALAKQAQDTADGKRRIFVDVPTTPYDRGDLWSQGANLPMMICVNGREEGEIQEEDWDYADNTSQLATEIAGYEYIKKAIQDGETIVTGGLIQSGILMLGYTNAGGAYQVMSGTNGIYDPSATGGGIAAWYGGRMSEDSAKAVIRFDGSGFFANKNFTWDAQGGAEFANGKIRITPQGALIFGDDIAFGSEEQETVASIIEGLSTVLSYFTLAGQNLTTKYNFVVEGDVASGGEGEDVVVGGVQAISVNGGNPIYPNEQGIIELNDIGGGDLDLETLATYLSDNKYISYNNLDTYGVATKSWVNEQGFAKASALSSYQPLSTAINTGNIANQKVAGLAKAVSIWGQSFDGTKDISGTLYMPNNTNIKMAIADGTAYCDVMYLATNNNLVIGNDVASSGFDTLLSGNAVRLRYGISRTNGLILNSSGNVGIGVDNPQYKLDVNGDIKGLSAILGDTTNQLKIFSTGALYNTSTTGGWHRRFGISVNDTAKFGIGAYGNGETLNYGYIGDSYSSPWIKITKSATTINGNLVVQGDVASA